MLGLLRHVGHLDYVAVARHAIQTIDHARKNMVAPRALVVDDNKDVAESFARVLESLGCQAQFVSDSRAAEEIAEDMQPEIIFLDIAMPGVDGYELARRFRAKYGWQVRIVAVTAHTGERDRALGRAAGFDAYMGKPASAEMVKSTLVTLFPEMRWQ